MPDTSSHENLNTASNAIHIAHGIHEMALHVTIACLVNPLLGLLVEGLQVVTRCRLPDFVDHPNVWIESQIGGMVPTKHGHGSIDIEDLRHMSGGQISSSHASFKRADWACLRRCTIWTTAQALIIRYHTTVLRRNPLSCKQVSEKTTQGNTKRYSFQWYQPRKETQNAKNQSSVTKKKHAEPLFRFFVKDTACAWCIGPSRMERESCNIGLQESNLPREHDP
mmetsp:Transcript_10997/g.20928  ORF Transcript_10997/g.20928 Transcript_10997/m.20928 type:complete len:223 (-) Transcript_10997:722-1390(-)